jgi:hypothetical protein
MRGFADLEGVIERAMETVRNIQHRTSNIQGRGNALHWMFDVGRWMLDVGCWMFYSEGRVEANPPSN